MLEHVFDIWLDLQYFRHRNRLSDDSGEDGDRDGDDDYTKDGDEDFDADEVDKDDGDGMHDLMCHVGSRSYHPVVMRAVSHK